MILRGIHSESRNSVNGELFVWRNFRPSTLKYGKPSSFIYIQDNLSKTTEKSNYNHS